MKSLPRVILSILIGFAFLLVIAPRSVKADVPCPPTINPGACAAINLIFSPQSTQPGPWYNQTSTQFSEKVFGGSQDEIFGERYTYAQINWIINSISAMLSPRINNPAQLFQFIDDMQKLSAQIQNGQSPSIADYGKLGPAGLFAGGVTALYVNPPASGVQEIKNVAQRIFDTGTGATPVYAQGYGYNGLNAGGGVHALWTASRNMSYLIMVVLLIAAGFLIMFRVKINPQTVVTLQTMIPKLIITMLLVTFSFAIAGLVVDLIYVVIVGFVGFMSLTGIMDAPGEIGAVIGRLINSSFWEYVWLQTSVWIFALAISVFIGGVVGGLLGFVPGGPIIGILVGIVIFVWLNITFVRIFLMLLRSYVMLILQICIGPLQIMLDLIPGQQGFGPWIRNIIANASVFVVVPIMLFVQYILSWSLVANNFLHIRDFRGMGGSSLSLPYTQLAGSGAFGNLGTWDFITPFFIGLFLFSITPRVAEIIRDALKIPAFRHGNALGQALGPYGNLANAGIGVARERLQRNVEDAPGSERGMISAMGVQAIDRLTPRRR